MALHSKNWAWRMERKKEVFAVPPILPCHGVVWVPMSPSPVWLQCCPISDFLWRYTAPQRKRSIPGCVRWNGDGCGFVVHVGIFFWFGKVLFNMFLAQIPFKQFLLCWIQVLLKAVRFFSLSLCSETFVYQARLRPFATEFLFRSDVVRHHWHYQHWWHF